MKARINNGKDSYLYSKVDTEIGNYQDMYNSSEEAFADIKEDIIEDCNKREYTKTETNTVLSYYESLFHNANGEWKDKY